MFIEPLESRIAPASLTFVDPKTVTWTDADGDLVTLKISTGALQEANFVHTDAGAGLVVNSLDLTDPKFAGASLTVTAKRVVSTNNAIGNGLVDLGYINATGNPLGSVVVSGDLGRIDAGLAVLTAKNFTALKSLSAGSFGARLDILGAVQAQSELNGKVGTITIGGDFLGAIHVSGAAQGSVDKLSAGAIIGSSLADSGRVDISGALKALNVVGSIQGGVGQHSGSVEAGGFIGPVTIGGSLSGGKGADPSADGTGVIRAGGNIASVAIAGSIYGGSQQESGLIEAGGAIARVSIGGGIYGGSAGQDSGGVQAGSLAALSVKGDIRGGAAQQSGFVLASSGGSVALASLLGGSGPGSGVIHFTGAAKSIALKGSLTGGSGDGSGEVTVNGSLGTLALGDLIGGAANTGQITVGGPLTSVVLANLFGGDASNSGTLNLGSVGTATVLGDIVGGSISSGASADVQTSGNFTAAHIGTMTIDGSVRAGADYSANYNLVNTAAVRVHNDLGTLVVKGALLGTVDTPVLITARGQAVPMLNSGIDLALGKATFGNVSHANVLIGYDTGSGLSSAAINPNAQIGSVTVTHNWEASNLVAGAAYSSTFGNGLDVKSAGVDNPNIIARIGSITIGGTITGTAAAGDSYGFVAQSIGSLKFGANNTVLLNAGKSNDNDPISLRYSLANTLDVRLFEFAS